MQKKELKTNNKKSKIFFPALYILIAVSSGFFGGWFGSQAKNSNSLVAQREIVTKEGDLINIIANDVGPSVVSINVVSTTGVRDVFGFSRKYQQESAGTGFIISKSGFIVTNRHVVSSSSSVVSITLSDGTEVKDVEIVGKTNPNDPLDIAFLKIKNTKDLDLKPVKLGDSSGVEVGDSVVAIGNALGQFQNTVTSGIISGYGRSVEAGDGSGANTETLQNLFQTDAAINGGNSGGPLVNSASEVIGINVATANAENISFSIPIDDVKGLIKTVLEKGKLERPYLGVRYVTITDDFAYEYNLPVKRGAYIAPSDVQDSIIKDSPADKAGLQEKDIITEIDGTKLDEKNSLISLLGRKSVGDKVSLKILRDGKEQTVEVKLEAAPTQ